jgi:DNA polymerase-4
MDAFYASVEQRDDASLRGRPVIVGGAFPRGVVSAASYEARVFGVRSAMSIVEAVRRCPNAHIVAPRHAYYSSISRQVFAIFHRFTPLVEGLSLDEAFLDVTASRSLYGDGKTIASLIKSAILSEVGLRASAGVAPSKFVAKIASDLEKPDALVVVMEDVRSFLAPLPIERMMGIGKKGAIRAHAFGFRTLGDLATADAIRLERAFGKWGLEMAQLARGNDPREVEPERTAKSIGAEETFDEDLRDVDEIARKLLSQSARVAERLHLSGLAGRGITVKLKYADFSIKTRSLQVPEAVSDTSSIYRAARELLDRFESARPVRLSGVSVSSLVAIEDARTLFPDPAVERGRKLEAAMARLRDRGAKMTRAALLRDDDER